MRGGDRRRSWRCPHQHRRRSASRHRAYPAWRRSKYRPRPVVGLHGWWAPSAIPSAIPRANDGGGTVVLMHGLRGNRLQMLNRARVLNEHGFSVLLFDFQASGESPGRRITLGKLEGLDAAAAVRFVRDRRPHERVGVYRYVAWWCRRAAESEAAGGRRVGAGVGVTRTSTRRFQTACACISAGLQGRCSLPLLASAFKLLLPPILDAAPSELRPIDHIATAGAPDPDRVWHCRRRHATDRGKRVIRSSV